ncbi:hypothetical protein Dda_7392 [Drechslerella dactyloides]|uniref:Uncharacterized protein n=1 Tax=Drechslerella dactyloides TaxID=74499 RepID=A0AAD6NFJ1_DREDA|nr:hypothetical protein Dda_7392 [Drechslerella dactyloides]
MPFTGLPEGAKYAIIGCLLGAGAILLFLMTYMWLRRRKVNTEWRTTDEKTIEEVVIFDSKSELDLPRTKRLTISGPLKALELEEEYKRTASMIPARGVARLHPSMLPIHVERDERERGPSVLKNVPKAVHLRPPVEPKPAKIHERNRTGPNVNVPTPKPASKPTPAPTAAARAAQAAAAIPIDSPSIYSPIELPDDAMQNPFQSLHEQLADISNALNTSLDTPLGSPTDDDPSYVRAPRLYEPPSMAFGHPELPQPPSTPRRKSKSVGRKRSVSVQDTAALLRMSSASAASSRRRSRRGDRSSTQSEWMDTLTIIDDGHDLSSQLSGSSISDSELFPQETQSEPEPDTKSEPESHPAGSSSQHLLVPRASTKRSRSPKQLPRNRTLLGGTMTSNNTAWNNTVIAEQMASIKYSTRRSKSPPKGPGSDKSDGW